VTPGPDDSSTAAETEPALSAGRLEAREQPIVNALTVDVEDYYQVAAFEPYVARSQWPEMERRVEGNTRRLLELFDSRRTRATFFFLGCVADEHPDLVREVFEAGHEVASHGWSHRSVGELSADDFRSEATDSKRLLEDLCGAEVTGFRAPNFSIDADTSWALDVLIEEGYRYDSSVREVLRPRPSFPPFPTRLRLEAGEIDEFPFSTFSLFGQRLPFTGGNYLRQLPTWIGHHGLKQLNRSFHQPAMVYVHPWEIDPDQPRIEVGRLTALRHYRNLETTQEKLRALLRRHRFDAMARVLRDCLPAGEPC
jgi:polysaccharide deacetylase family protein (PEP-CTERM system associated)